VTRELHRGTDSALAGWTSTGGIGRHPFCSLSQWTCG